MIYVYAVTDPPSAPLPPMEALQDQPVSVLRGDGLAAVYSRHPSGTFRPNRDNLWRHEKVGEALMQHGAVLPVRFGTTFTRTEDLTAALNERHEKLLEGLQQVRGLVELGVRVLWNPPDTPSPDPGAACGSDSSPNQPGSGLAYMQRRLREEQHRREIEARARELADRVHRPIAAHAQEAKRRMLITPETLMSGAYLLPPSRMEAFKRCVRELTQAHHGLRLLCTGPWPAYHFTPSLEPEH